VVEHPHRPTPTSLSLLRAGVTTFFFEGTRAETIELGESAAHHARVKRLAPGDPVNVTNGEGQFGTGRIEAIGKSSLRVVVRDLRLLPAPPAIHLCVPVADKDRMLWVAEKATELQVASWIPVMYSRSRSVSPRGEGESFDRKVLARMIAALEQSGGAWLPQIHPIQLVEDIADRRGIVLERGGPPLGKSELTDPLTIAVGPEGGFEPEELETLRDRGWLAASLGDVTLRFETAAIGAVAIARALVT
jgi:16S rRNA (uracil1498-N3)-methyltransferase